VALVAEIDAARPADRPLASALRVHALLAGRKAGGVAGTR
jgi:predicted DNA-binding ribbon-helix-helix protein